METLDAPEHLIPPWCHYRSPPPPNSFRIGCLAGSYWHTSRITPILIELSSWVHLPLRISHAYPRHQLSDTAKGLCYIHSCNAIHEDLKGVRSFSEYSFTVILMCGRKNVLVDRSARIRNSPRLLKTWIQSGIHWSNMAAPHNGLCQRSWVGVRIAGKGTFSLSRWPRSRYVTIDLSCAELWLTVISHRYRYLLVRFRSVVLRI